jgi:hypothetical protein
VQPLSLFPAFLAVGAGCVRRDCLLEEEKGLFCHEWGPPQVLGPATSQR